LLFLRYFGTLLLYFHRKGFKGIFCIVFSKNLCVFIALYGKKVCRITKNFPKFPENRLQFRI